MFYCKISAGTTVTTHTPKNLVEAWKVYGHTGLIKAFHCEQALTASQLRRLPKGLRERLTVG